MNTQPMWTNGDRLAPIVVEPNTGQKRLPPFSHILSPPLQTRHPSPIPPKVLLERPRRHTQVPHVRPVPSSPLARSPVINELQKPFVERQLSPPRSVASTSSGLPRKREKRSHTGPSSHYSLASTMGQSKTVRPPASMLPPSPPLTSYSSEPNLSMHGTSTVSTITADVVCDKSLPESNGNENIDEMITTLIRLDYINTGLVQGARDELDSLFGKKGDPIEREIEAQEARRQSLLTAWGQDPATLLRDKTLANYSMRCMILDIDRRLKILHTVQQSEKPSNNSQTIT